MHQAEIEVHDLDHASARWAMSDYVVPAAGSGRGPFHGHGHYLEQNRRIGGSWKIVDLELARLPLGTGAERRLPVDGAGVTLPGAPAASVPITPRGSRS